MRILLITVCINYVCNIFHLAITVFFLLHLLHYYYMITTLLFHLALFYASVIESSALFLKHFIQHFKFIQFNVCVGEWEL